MNKVFVMVGVLALGALGLAFVFKSQTSTAKTVTLEPNRVIKRAKPNSSIKPAGSLKDLTKNAPEPRAVTTDAIVVPPKPTPAVSSASEVISAKPEVVKAKPEVRVPTSVETSGQVTKPVPEITKPIEQPQQVPSTAETPTASETSSTAQKPVTTEISSSVPVPALPLQRSPGSISIQAGAFKNADNAQALRVQLISQGFKTSIELGEDGISRVIVGPYPNEQTARDAMSKISSR